MTSESILIKDPAQTQYINDPTHEAIRLKFLQRLLETPCIVSCAKCICDYLDSSMVGINYQYQFVSKNWKKNGTINNFAKQEIVTKIVDYEQASFVKDCVNVIIQDAQYAMDQQQIIIDDTNSTEQQVKDALAEKWRCMNIRDSLKEYRKDQLKIEIIEGEIIPLLHYFKALNE